MPAAEVNIYSGRGGADCSYHFRLGKSYLVDPYDHDGKLFATICSDTQPVEGAEGLLSELRARRDGKKYASLYGTLRRTQQPYDATAYADYDRPLPGVSVQLRGESHTYSAQTDQNGVYRFYEVPAGTYHFEATLPANLQLAKTILSDPIPQITLPDNACYQDDIDALPTSRIRGRVIGPDGSPLKNADVELFRKERYKESDLGWWEFQDEEAGHFEFDNITPGVYVIVFHNSNRPDPDIPYPRTFYPGTPDFASALPLTVGDGQQILDADIHVSSGSTTRLLTVRVSWSQTPTPDDVFVTAEASSGPEIYGKNLAPGVYELTLFRDAHYSIFASQDCGLRWEGNTGTPIGDRETQRIELDGSDSRTTEIFLSLQDESCKPYHWQAH
jgi:hypothetical protein